MKYQTLILLLAGALGMTGCATSSNCAGWRPIRPSVQDRATPQTQSQIIAHNTFGVQAGCWRAP